jgi:tetratricopeptide (TPR) repeat protein
MTVRFTAALCWFVGVLVPQAAFAQNAKDSESASVDAAEALEGAPPGEVGAAPSGSHSSKPAAGAHSSPLLDIGLAAALERARSFYQNGRYDSCVVSYGELFDQADELSAEVTVDVLEQARVHYAACLLADGNSERADEQFRAALEANPLMAAPDPVLFPGQVRDLFFKVKADFLEAIRRVQDEKLERARLESVERARRAQQERERVRRLEAIAATEGVVSLNRRWVSALPFGVGQFQNGDDVLGTFFLATEVLLAAGCISATAVELNTHHQAEGGRAVYPSAAPFNERLQLAHRIELGSGIGLIAMALIGIVQAQVAFVPEVVVGTRARQLPGQLLRSPASKAPRVNANIGTDSAWLGVRGSF